MPDTGIIRCQCSTEQLMKCFSQIQLRKTLFRLSYLLLALLFIGACAEKSSHDPAPLGDKAALEKLADAYRKLSDDLPVTPAGLRPAARRKFLEQVFQTAGYDYSSTLIALATLPPGNINQYHRDLKQLLYLPHYDKRIEKLSDIYSEKEILAITAIDKLIK